MVQAALSFGGQAEKLETSKRFCIEIVQTRSSGVNVRGKKAT
jgi:hypothetical protein